MNGLDLFSGIGGLTEALAGYSAPLAYCENNRYAQAVLLSRMAAGELPAAPIWDDVQTLNATHLPRPLDIIYGGFPCQDISVAGRGEGLGGERSGLFFEIARLVGELGPRFVFLENVPAIRSRGADVVAGRLASLGYDCRWSPLSAADVGANHLRERWWLLGYAKRGGRDRKPWGGSGQILTDGHIGVEEEPASNATSGGARPVSAGPRSKGKRTRDANRNRQDVANANSPRKSSGNLRSEAAGVSDSTGASSDMADAVRRWKGFHAAARHDGENVSDPFGAGPPFRSNKKNLPFWDEAWRQRPQRCDWWSTEPDVGRVAHGVPYRVDRLRALGNSVVPAQAREAFERLIGVKA